MTNESKKELDEGVRRAYEAEVSGTDDINEMGRIVEAWEMRNGILVKVRHWEKL